MDMLLAYNIDISFFIDRKHLNYKKICGRVVYSRSVLNSKKHFVVLFHHSYLTIESMRKELERSNFTNDDCFDWRTDADRDIDWLSVKIGRRSAITKLAVLSSGRSCLKSIDFLLNKSQFWSAYNGGTGMMKQCGLMLIVSLTPVCFSGNFVRRGIQHGSRQAVI